MKNYTVKPIKQSHASPDGFAVCDEFGKMVCFCIDEATASVFAHVPELLEMLDACVDTQKPYTFSDACELQKKLNPFRK